MLANVVKVSWIKKFNLVWVHLSVNMADIKAFYKAQTFPPVHLLEDLNSDFKAMTAGVLERKVDAFRIGINCSQYQVAISGIAPLNTCITALTSASSHGRCCLT